MWCITGYESNIDKNIYNYITTLICDSLYNVIIFLKYMGYLAYVLIK